MYVLHEKRVICNQQSDSQKQFKIVLSIHWSIRNVVESEWTDSLFKRDNFTNLATADDHFIQKRWVWIELALIVFVSIDSS